MLYIALTFSFWNNKIEPIACLRSDYATLPSPITSSLINTSQVISKQSLIIKEHLPRLCLLALGSCKIHKKVLNSRPQGSSISLLPTYKKTLIGRQKKKNFFPVCFLFLLNFLRLASIVALHFLTLRLPLTTNLLIYNYPFLNFF